MANKIRTAFLNFFAGDIIEERIRQAVGLVGTDSADENKYRRLNEQSIRDLMPMKYSEMQKLAFFEWQRYPLAHRMIGIIVDFLCGEEFSVDVSIVKDDPNKQEVNTGREDAQTIWNEFFSDPVNRLKTELDQLWTTCLINGELLLPSVVNKISGAVRLGFIDPIYIVDVYTNARDQRVVEKVKIKMDGLSEEVIDVVRPQLNPNSTAFEKLDASKPTANDNLLDGGAIYFQINKIAGQKRGHSELMELLDWIKGLETFLFDAMKGFSVRNVFMWHVTQKGKSANQIQNEAVPLPPRIGAVVKTNELEEWEAKSPDLKATDASEGVRLVKNFILGAKSFPEHWFADGGNTNLATATAQHSPTMRMLKAKQAQLRNFFLLLAQYVMDQAEIAGTLKLADNECVRIKINMFDFDRADQSQLGAAFVQVITAVVSAKNAGLMSADTGKNLVDNFVKQFGVQVPEGETPETIAAEAAKKAKVDTGGIYDAANPPNLTETNMAEAMSQSLKAFEEIIRKFEDRDRLRIIDQIRQADTRSAQTLRIEVARQPMDFDFVRDEKTGRTIGMRGKASGKAFNFTHDDSGRVNGFEQGEQ